MSNRQEFIEQVAVGSPDGKSLERGTIRFDGHARAEPPTARHVRNGLIPLVLWLALAGSGCSDFETRQRRFDTRAEWSDAPDYVPTGASDIHLARNIDIECRQWVRFDFTRSDSMHLSTIGDSLEAAFNASRPTPSPSWWTLRDDGVGMSMRAVSEFGWDGTLLVDWTARRAYFLGC